MESIMHDNENCYICGAVATEWHHVFGGTANRKKSEKYGLKIKLCHSCHRTGSQAVHTHKPTRLIIQNIGQMKFAETYKDLDFREIFGKNYMQD